MNIKFLKAGGGDSILIESEGHNILIDGGAETFHLFDQLQLIRERGEVLNLVIITHHDADHIFGILQFLRELKKGKFGDPKSFVKKILFNSPRKVLGIKIPPKDNLLSYKQAYKVEELIDELKLEWQTCTEKTKPIKFGQLELEFLSPIDKDIEEYSSNDNAYLSSDDRCDWNSTIKELLNYVDDVDLDKSLSNQTSIVVLLKCDSKKILLTGDVTPKRLGNAISEYLNKENKQNLPLDYMKLPHHGSYRSLSETILNKLSCSDFIISTNSSRYYLPNKRALVKVISHISSNKRKINFYFNYVESLDKLKIHPFEEREYNFKLVRNNKDYGLEI